MSSNIKKYIFKYLIDNDREKRNSWEVLNNLEIDYYMITMKTKYAKKYILDFEKLY